MSFGAGAEIVPDPLSHNLLTKMNKNRGRKGRRGRREGGESVPRNCSEQTTLATSTPSDDQEGFFFWEDEAHILPQSPLVVWRVEGDVIKINVLAHLRLK